MQTLKPIVTLFSHTKDPLACIALGFDAWSAKKMPTEVTYWSREELEERFRKTLTIPHQTNFEYVSFTWVIDNVSRAFQAQLIRHRVGFSYSIQSLRQISVEDFAARGAYTLPPTVVDKEAYHSCMLMIQDQYNAAVRSGMITGDARGLLPMNIHSPITFSCSYRALVGMLKQRYCIDSRAENEWVSVADQIRACLVSVEPILAEPLDCLCGRFKNNKGFCKSLKRAVTNED